MMAGTALDIVEDDSISGKMLRTTVLFWLPNMLVTLQVYAKFLILVGMSVSLSKELLPLASTSSFISSHSIDSTARSVVQLSVADDPYGRGNSCPCIFIPKYHINKR